MLQLTFDAIVIVATSYCHCALYYQYSMFVVSKILIPTSHLQVPNCIRTRNGGSFVNVWFGMGERSQVTTRESSRRLWLLGFYKAKCTSTISRLFLFFSLYSVELNVVIFNWVTFSQIECHYAFNQIKYHYI